MPLYEIFSYNVGVQYKSTLCSRATFFIIITSIIAIVSPFIIAYRSRGFWLKNYIFYEQPNVHFKYQYFFIAETDDLNYVITCGNMPNISKYIFLEDCLHVQVLENDNTLDKKNDEIFFSLKVNNPSIKNILNIRLFLVLDYVLNGVCPLQMESLIVHMKEFNLPANKHFVTANLGLIQSFPLPCWYNNRDIQYNQSIIPQNNVEKDNWLERVLYEYSRRNFSTVLMNEFTSTKYGTLDTFRIEILVAIGEHSIRYRPGLWQELKYSWQQYLSIGIIFYWVYMKINKFVFENNILPSWEYKPWKKLF